jgi:tetratricopeptide (TPR) repeat protein
VLRMALRRRAGRPGAAEEAYGKAVLLLAAMSPEAEERGWLLVALGQLRWAQGRYDEARALLGSAAWTLRRASADQAEGASRLLAGLLDYDAAPSRARAELERGLSVLDPDLAPALVEGAQCAEICCNVRERRRGEADRLLREYGGEAFRGRGAGPGTEAYLLLWHCRLLDCLGSRKEAAELRETLRGVLLRRGSLREAATFAIGNLLRQWNDEIHPQALESLASDLREAFGSAIPAAEGCAREIETLVTLFLKRSPVFPDRAKASLLEWTTYNGEDRRDLLAAPPDLADLALAYELVGVVEDEETSDVADE